MREMIEVLREKMAAGVAEFSYIKKDGSNREAHGTTKMELIPEEMRPKSGKVEEYSTVQNYFDVDKKEWRAFRIKSLNNVK